MKTLFPLLGFLLLFFGTGHAHEDGIQIQVIVKNHTAYPLSEGTLFIAELNQKVAINDSGSIRLNLPKKGKYHFSFASPQFRAYLDYPKRISNKKNTITIVLTEVNLGQRMQPDTAFLWDEPFFIIHGKEATPSNEKQKRFTQKYGVVFKVQDCRTNPVSFRFALEHNREVSDYLDGRYGHRWRKELSQPPFGLDLDMPLKARTSIIP
jgi:hypothetical protein